jgi:hypothetical protein
MISIAVYAIPFALGAILLVALIRAAVNFRRGRRAPYYRIRRTASTHAWRWVLAAVVLAVGIAASLRLRRLVPPPELPRLFAPPPTETAAVSATLPLSQSLPAVVTSSVLPPTITPTLPTPTQSPTPYIATIASAVTPPAGAQVLITDISSDISSNLTPVNAGETFPAGIRRLYFWLEFSGMADGVSWSRVLLLNGEVVRSESETWERGAAGTAYYWFEAQGGWPAGSYEVQFFIGDRLIASKTFDVIN